MFFTRLVAIGIALTMNATLAMAAVTQEQPVKIAPGTAQLFFITLGKTKLTTLTDENNSPLLQDTYFKWSLRWVPDTGEGVNFLSPILSRCEEKTTRPHEVTCMDQLRLVVMEAGIIESVTFLNPRYLVTIGGKTFGRGSSWTAVEATLGRKLQPPNVTDPDKSECVMTEGTPGCCPKELKNICIDFTYDKLPADGGKLVIGNWTLMSSGKKP